MNNPRSLTAAANFYKSALDQNKDKDCNCWLNNNKCKCDD